MGIIAQLSTHCLEHSAKATAIELMFAEAEAHHNCFFICLATSAKS